MANAKARYLRKSYTEGRDKALSAVAASELAEAQKAVGFFEPDWVVALEEDADFMTFEAADAHSGKSWCDVCGGRCEVC